MTRPDLAETSVGEQRSEGPPLVDPLRSERRPLPPGPMESYSLETLEALLDN